MKIFMKVLTIIALVFVGVMFYNSGKTARDDKYIKDVILVNKGDNTLENNQKESFVADMFAVNSLVYKSEKVGTIEFSKNIIDNNQSKDIYVHIDIYQVMGLFINEEIPAQFQGVLNEFSVNGETKDNLTITGYYEKPLYGENHNESYTITNRNFPLFGLNHTITGGKLNKLDSIIFEYHSSKKIELFELIVNESKSDLEDKFSLKAMPGYPLDELEMQEIITKTLTTKSGGFKYPSKEEVENLNKLGYNFKLFEGQEKYNYLIYSYLGIYLLIFIISIFYLLIKPYKIKKRNLNK